MSDICDLWIHWLYISVFNNVMVNSMGQHDYAKGFSGTWSSIILGVSMRVFFKEFNIKIGRLSKAYFPLWC